MKVLTRIIPQPICFRTPTYINIALQKHHNIQME